MSRAKRAAAEKEAQEIQRYIRHRVGIAMGGRSLNWLAKESGIPQSTLHGYQQTGVNHYTLDALVAVANALGQPFSYFLPRPDGASLGDRDIVALAAFQRVVHAVDWWQTATPDEVAQARDADGRVRDAISGHSPGNEPPPKSHPPSGRLTSDKAPAADPTRS